MELDWKKLLGYALLFWVIMFVVACIFVGFKVGDTMWAQIVMWIAAIIVIWLLAPLAGARDLQKGLIIGVVFVVVGLILDYIITVRFTGMEFFNSWELWTSYGLTIVVAAIRGSMAK